MKRETIGRVLTAGALAGVAGGIAEVAWISLYAAATGGDAASVARGVTDTVGIGILPPIAGGVAIHMALAAILGMAVAAALVPTRLHGARLYGAMIGALSAVWAINFLVVLPLINPQFVEIVPLAVSFVSKLLFGVAAATTLLLAPRAAPDRAHTFSSPRPIPAIAGSGSAPLRHRPDRSPWGFRRRTS